MTGKIRGIAFDAFGTLVTSVGRNGPYQRLAAAADVDPRQFRLDAMTRNLRLSELAAELGREHMADELTKALEVELETVTLYRDAIDCLSFLGQNNIPYVVCSNLGHGYGQKIKDLVPHVRGYVMSYEVGASKPDARMYASVVEILGVPADEVFFVGDTVKADFEGPISFGMRAAHLDRKMGGDLHLAVARALSDANGASILER